LRGVVLLLLACLLWCPLMLAWIWQMQELLQKW
jgi:hypothetical protein